MSPVTFLTKIRDFAKVRSLFSRIGSSVFKYFKIFFQNESVKAVMAHTFPPGVRNGNAGVTRHEIAVFDPQA